MTTPLSPLEVSEHIDDKMKSFKQLLDDLTTLDDKKKRLWMEIYENAVSDRQMAYTMYATLTGICQNKSSEFAVHGRTITSYIERMNKANDQLIKLATLIAAEHAKSEKIDPDDIYCQVLENN